MSVYTTNTQIVEEYYTRHNRVEGWIANHESVDFASPNVPPSLLDGEVIPGSPMSDTFSSKSVPPRLLLRYNDGRPDQPIPNPQRDARKKKNSKSSRDATSPTSSDSHERSRSLTGRSRHGQEEELRSNSPEEIMILPSQHSSTRPPTRAPSHHTQSPTLRPVMAATTATTLAPGRYPGMHSPSISRSCRPFPRLYQPRHLHRHSILPTPTSNSLHLSQFPLAITVFLKSTSLRQWYTLPRIISVAATTRPRYITTTRM
ncbi:hypothetical protein CPB85DRAFT_131433 [Mucidula mucida]|nr:hypothetical protein CPB85DRAFT_131433 [Mucidula mucida]